MQRLRFHHVGIPTERRLEKSDSKEGSKRRDWGYFDNPYGIEWHNFDADNDLPELIRTRPHVGFVVDSLEEAIRGKQIVLTPTSPAEGVTVAFILDGEALVEFLQFDRPEEEIWPHPTKFQV